MGDVLLDISNLTIAYDKVEYIVVDSFSMKVETGKVVAIVGESGSGKTSVIRAIMGILNPSGLVTEGTALFNGQTILDAQNKKKQKKQKLAQKTGKEMTFVFQNSSSTLNPIATIGKQYIEYIRVHTKMSKADARQLAVETLKKVQLKDAENLMSSYPFELSGGMQQRVGIAMAITFNPKLILADEPTSALDVTTQIQVLELLKEINETYGTAIVMVTHNLGAASFLADDCIVMYEGKVVERNSMREILKNPRELYTKKLIEATILEEGYHDR